ncbi:MAG: hypothetical protein K2X82_11575 [Gemmataceae bacterium]|nr:hypothetical protein [Gemmataceae bacterium]
MRASRWVAAVLFAAGAVAVIGAQPPGGRGGPVPVDRDGLMGLLVVTNPALQAELKVTAEQQGKFKPLAERQQALGKRAAEILAVIKQTKDNNRLKELLAEMREQNERLKADVKKVVGETLTADQKARLKQVERQMAGPRAFQDGEVAAGLKLTDAQKGKIRGIIDDIERDGKELFTGVVGKNGVDPGRMAEYEKKAEKLAEAATARIQDVLTDDQKKTWKEMVGAPVDTAKLFQLPDGGGGGKRPKD